LNKNIGEVNNSMLLDEYVLLHMALSSDALTQQQDQITWKWIRDGQFSVSSGYNCQFRGIISYFPTTDLLKATTPNKCNFFAWLVLHNKALSADNMAKKNWQCDPNCQLCFCELETIQHLLIDCNYAEAT
jgi:hypothetical protein